MRLARRPLEYDLIYVIGAGIAAYYLNVFVLISAALPKGAGPASMARRQSSRIRGKQRRCAVRLVVASSQRR